MGGGRAGLAVRLSVACARTHAGSIVLASVGGATGASVTACDACELGSIATSRPFGEGFRWVGGVTGCDGPRPNSPHRDPGHGEVDRAR